MKKYLIFLLLFGLIAAFIAAPTTISAKGPIPPAPHLEVWEWYGEGVSGEEIPMFKITTTPREWLQLKANGLKVDGATKICHGFDAGRYGWTGEIYHLVEGAWVKLPTTVGWVPTEEGHYMACAMAPAAGSYALFGYFDKAKAPVVEKGLPGCYSLGLGPNMVGIDWDFDDFPPNVIFGPLYGIFSLIPNTEITYEIINADPPLTGSLTGMTFTDAVGEFTFAPSEWYYSSLEKSEGVFTIHIVFPICYYDWTIHWGGTD